MIHAALGDVDAAFGRLRDAIVSRSAWFAYRGVDPRRKDARYAQLESELELQDTAKVHAQRPRQET